MREFDRTSPLRRAAVMWPLATLSLLVVLLFLLATRWEQERIQREFRDHAAQMTHGVERTLKQHLDLLESVHDFVASSPDLDRQAFQTFAAGTLSRGPGVQAISWDVRVPESQPSAMDPKRRPVRAAPGDEYVVEYYVEPHSEDASVLEFDPASDAVRRRALTLAREGDRPIASPVVQLGQDRSEGFILVRPVYAVGLPHTTTEERRRSLRGFVTAIVRVADLVQISVEEFNHDGIELRLFDQTAPGAEQLLYVHPRLSVASTFELAGRRWGVRASPGPEYLAAHRAWQAWAVLAAGLLFTGLVGAFLLMITGRAGRAEIDVGAHSDSDPKTLERMKDDFIGAVSHELRTPLAAIKGFVELMADGEAGPVNEVQRDFLEICARNADRLNALISDLLDVSRMESRGLELREDPVDLSDLLGNVAADFRAAAEAKGLEFRADVAELPLIMGDRDRLIQVFTNLVSNAIKYTPAGRVDLDGRVRQAEVEIVVQDTGIGLSPEDQAQLFTKFFRGTHRIVREAGGTGLGLVIAGAIVQRHGGRIDVESVPAAGTRFRVFLPLSSPPDSSAAA